VFRILVLGLLVCVLSVRTADAQPKTTPRFGVVVGEDKRGILVAGVTVGGLADLMGLREGDLITNFTFDPPGGELITKERPTLTDLKPLFDCRPGKYKLVVQHKSGGAPTSIAGSVTRSKADPEKPLFLPDKPGSRQP
jgi:hypothetical protein